MPNRTPEYMRAYYQANRERILRNAAKRYAANREQADEKARARRARNKEYLDGLKSSTPCTDCGIEYPPYVMDFDHTRGEKVTNIAKVARLWSIKRLDTEISKCDIVCSNCHRERTFGNRVVFKPKIIVPDIDVR